MSDGKNFNLRRLEPDLQNLVDVVRSLAKERQGNALALLALLRTLESLHQEIRDSLFQESLPDNRQALYSLLRNIESSGGWPYIYRMKLQQLLANLEPSTSALDETSDPSLTTASLEHSAPIMAPEQQIDPS